MYSLIVKDDDDIIGLVAYALYKRHKIEFFNAARKANDGAEPSREAIIAFIQGASTESQINNYRDQAGSILMDVVVNVTEEQIRQASDEMLQNYEAKISEAVKRQTPNWVTTVGLNILGTFLFSVIITIVFIVGNFSERGTKSIADQVVTTLNSEERSATPIQSADTIRHTYPL